MHTYLFKESLLALTWLLLIGGTACSMIHDNTTPGGSGRVSVTQADDALVITNRTDAPIWTFAAGQRALTTMFWAPRLDGDSIASGDSARVDIADIPQQDDEQEIVVFWWQAVNQDGERVAGDPQSIVIAL